MVGFDVFIHELTQLAERASVVVAGQAAVAMALSAGKVVQVAPGSLLPGTAQFGMGLRRSGVSRTRQMPVHISNGRQSHLEPPTSQTALNGVAWKTRSSPRHR
jgi:hypothetical protein